MAEAKNKQNVEEVAALTETEVNEQMQVRIDKMHKIEEHGWKPFGHRYLWTHRAADIAAQFEELSANETQVKMAGRIMAIRGHGKTCFMDMQDKTGRIQVYVRKDVIGEENYALIKLMDIGDTVGVTVLPSALIWAGCLSKQMLSKCCLNPCVRCPKNGTA